MSLTLEEAERLLRERLGEPINRVTRRGPRTGLDNLKVLGFAANGRVLALNRQAKRAPRLWIEPPAPTQLRGVRSTAGTAPQNHDLTGRLSVLRPPNGREVELTSEEGVGSLLDWYGGITAEEPGSIAESTRGVPPSPMPASGTISPLAVAVAEMCDTVETTVAASNGQTEERTIKNKELRMTRRELEGLLASLLEDTGSRCALSGMPFQFSGPDSDLRPSVDRIDSNGHYERGNIQVVCRFLNRWKSDGDNDEFKRLLSLVRNAHMGNQ